MLASAVTAANPTTSSDQGPAAFMWPADRIWSAAADNTAPCGSIATVGNRTTFPMSKHQTKPSCIKVLSANIATANGQVALVDQKEAYKVTLSISYKEGMFLT